MKKISISIIALVFVCTVMATPVKASANTTLVQQNQQLIQLLYEMLAVLQAQLDALLAEQPPETSDSSVESNTQTNTVTVLQPNGGENYPSDKGAFHAKWNAGGSKVNVYLMSKDGVNQYILLGKNVSESSMDIQLSEAYTAKDHQSYRLKVCIVDTSVCDLSDDSFSFSWLDTMSAPATVTNI